MLKIRFFRTGRKKQPFYKIVVTDKNNPPAGGRFVEELGYYNPLDKDFRIKEERVREWMEKGAQPSSSLKNLLIKKGVIKGKKVDVSPKGESTDVGVEEEQTESGTEKEENLEKEQAGSDPEKEEGLEEEQAGSDPEGEKEESVESTDAAPEDESEEKEK